MQPAVPGPLGCGRAGYPTVRNGRRHPDPHHGRARRRALPALLLAETQVSVPPFRLRTYILSHIPTLSDSPHHPRIHPSVCSRYRDRAHLLECKIAKRRVEAARARDRVTRLLEKDQAVRDACLLKVFILEQVRKGRNEFGRVSGCLSDKQACLPIVPIVPCPDP